ncbi:quinate repressor [Magnaporthiopsis poae ATCC 64411]|uniref:Quinate repressor n=1 Tax=Magnaporthiopsis poae (strain ATCC 64411 / 73-15) TaxID=644358 RepID=A0A0C4DP99_MAGP6|nr:quinate repressor [Magnaporthiopsis poae ATCC 64411]
MTALSVAAENNGQPPATGAAPVNRRLYNPEASIVLVGSRGAGKRSLGFIAALHLRRRLVIEDHCFEQVTGVSRATFLRQHDKDAFARKNADVFKQMLDTNRKGCVIVCGMTSLSDEAQSLLDQYTATNPVVYVHRERERVVEFLDSADADLLLEADQSHRRCSNFEYYNLYDTFSSRSDSPGETTPRWDALSASSSTLLSAKEDFTTFLDLLHGQGWRRKWLESPFALNALPPEFRQYSYALRLRLSWLLDMALAWDDMEAAGDCVELIIDCWPEDMANVIAKQVALIRRRLSCPVIYHVEEKPRGQRRRSPEEADLVDADLLGLGLRLNVDYISLDLQRNPALVNRILEHRGRTRVIGNFWYNGLSALAWTDPAQLDNYLRAQELGCDVVRMVRFCSGDSPVEKLAGFRERVQLTVPDPKPPLVAYDYSVLGTRTPYQSCILNPVKPPGMDNSDHLATVCTYRSTFEQLFTQFLLDPLRFYVLGRNVSYSISPAMHQAAYEFSRMPHTFQSVSCSTLEELNQISRATSFGGASLAAPFKVAIMPHLKLKSHHASVIGAVNVLLPLRGQAGTIISHSTSRNKAGPVTDFYGDNTDWSSILTCLRRAISPRNYVRPSKTTALVIGAGGMARAAIYALIQLGCRNIFIYNRTSENAVRIAEHFNRVVRTKNVSSSIATQAQVCHVLSSISQDWPQPYQPPTIIISCVPATSVDGGTPSDFELPQQWLGSPTGGVVVELAYELLITPLVAQMQVFRDTVSPSWVVVDGLEVVSEMAIEAFELMTGRMAPKKLMRSVCRSTWEQQSRELSSMS